MPASVLLLRGFGLHDGSLTARLSNPTQNDLPPPYSVAVHTQPPLRKDEEVVYDVRPGLTPATYPHYIPQHPPPVVIPQAAGGHFNVSSTPLRRKRCVNMCEANVYRVPVGVCLFAAPSSKRKGCCKSNSQCYGSAGGILLLLALLALAIWLGGRLHCAGSPTRPLAEQHHLADSDSM